MNTVMDDNRMLTLASNERIPLTPTMRLLLEINHMNHCSPATVSRGGVIYVNATDIGWQPVGFFPSLTYLLLTECCTFSCIMIQQLASLSSQHRILKQCCWTQGAWRSFSLR